MLLTFLPFCCTMYFMNEEITVSEQSRFKDVAVRAGKIVGGLVVGAATGYAMSKGIQEIVPVDSDLAGLHDTVVAGTFALFGAGLAAEVSQ
jgi:hypothetical protein